MHIACLEGKYFVSTFDFLSFIFTKKKFPFIVAQRMFGSQKMWREWQNMEKQHKVRFYSVERKFFFYLATSKREIFHNRNWYDLPDVCRHWASFASCEYVWNQLIGSRHSAKTAPYPFNRIWVRLLCYYLLSFLCYIGAHTIDLFRMKVRGLQHPVEFMGILWASFHCYLCDKKNIISMRS